MHAIADTNQLVTDQIITASQAQAIEVRAREIMVRLAINSILTFGIVAATGGLIVWLGTPFSVAVYGVLALGLGVSVLVFGSATIRLFGNAASLIGAGMLIGGTGVELMKNYQSIAGPFMIFAGLIVGAFAAWILRTDAKAARFVTGAIMLMGVTMHLVGLGFELFQNGAMGVSISLFYLYTAVLIAIAGWMTDVRLVTALAIVPFAQALDAGTFYAHAAYAFYSPEPTLSILQMALLIGVSLWVAARYPEPIARHARVLAVMAFVVANICALVGSLWGDFVGETLWGPGNQWYIGEEWAEKRRAFQESALYLSPNLYSVMWAVALVMVILWSAHKARRGLFNAALTFAGIHAYTQMFESFGDQPLAYVIGGLAAIPLAWGLWRLDQWVVARGNIETPEPA